MAEPTERARAALRDLADPGRGHVRVVATPPTPAERELVWTCSAGFLAGVTVSGLTGSLPVALAAVAAGNVAGLLAVRARAVAHE